VVVALALALLALRRPVAALDDGDAALAGASRMLTRPWSAALLLSLVPAGWLVSAHLSPALRDLILLLFMVPLLRLLPGLIPARFRGPLYALAPLFALDKLAAVAPPRTLLARLLVLAVTVAAGAALARGLRPGGWARFERLGGWGAAARIGALAGLALLAVSLGSNLVGNATLAERLTHAVVSAAGRAAALLGVLAALEGALAAVLHLPALQRRPLVARHRPLLQRRCATALRLVGALAWGLRTLVELGILEPLFAALGAVLDLRLQVGGLDVSLGNVVAFGLTLALALGVARLVRFVLDEGVFAELDLPRGLPTALSTTVQYALVVLGFTWAVLASGMETSRFSFLVGALGLGVGFGLQNVVNNLVSGLILLYERPVQLGDVVEVGQVSGQVTRIGVRSSTVRTFAGAEVIVPNATLISAEVTNWTLTDRRRRVELLVGVAYGTPPRQVLDLLLEAVRGREGVAAEPAPAALFLRFGESAIEFSLRFWTEDADRWQVLASDVTIDVYERLGRAGIEIPFPQRDLHVRSVDPGAAAALAGPAAPRDPAP
jgi:small-conductance mechanosensitive channel